MALGSSTDIGAVMADALLKDTANGSIEKDTDFSIRHNVFFLQICSSIPTVLFQYFFHLETASLKTH